jgi:hypothetical protein
VLAAIPCERDEKPIRIKSLRALRERHYVPKVTK